jgi:hypothetical protein
VTTDKRAIVIVTACMNRDGTPTFALNEVEATQAEIDNGIHYYLAEADLLQAGYEEPFVHFDETEGPAFLHPAVRRHLRLSAGDNTHVLAEELSHVPSH